MQETVALREASEKPQLNVNLSINQSTVVVLNIRNNGKGSAENLRFLLDRDFHQFGEADSERNIRNFSFFSDQIKAFPPGSEVSFMLSQGFNFDNKSFSGDIITPLEFIITAEYEWIGKKYSMNFPINVQSYLRSNPIVSDELHELKKIREAIEKIATKN